MDVAETLTPEPIAPQVEAPVSDESESLADHESQFGPPEKRAQSDDDADADRAANGRFQKPAHRAESHRAKSGDVEEIQAQTARLRKAEAEAGITAPEKKQGESDRAYNLRRQADIAEALRDARKAPQNGSGTRQDAPHAPIAAPAGRRAAVPYDEPVPRPEDFGQSENPAEDYYRAIAGHEFRRQIHEAQQALLAQQAETEYRAAIEDSDRLRTTLHTKLDAYEAENPGFQSRLKASENIKMPDMLAAAIMNDVDTAPKLMDYLASHPDDLVDMIGYAASFGNDFSADTIGIVRRRLGRYISQAQGASRHGSTGTPALAQPVLVAPRPPMPVRTGPLKTGDEPPGDDSSLADHEKAFGPKRRR